MKIQCDVCERQQASVFCSADEAALCRVCDGHVHHANKLASKHLRFSLIPPPPHSSSPPLCDICQERRGFLFCKEDRAILCRECDFPIHSASQHTQKHSRFLFTGIKLSPSSSVYSSDVVTTTTTTSSNPTLLAGCSSDGVAHTRSPLSSSVTTSSYQAPCSYNNQFQMGSDHEGSTFSTTDCNISDYYTTTSSEVMPQLAPPSSDCLINDLWFSDSSNSHFFDS